MIIKKSKFFESTQDIFEIAKIHLGFCNKTSVSFCSECKSLFPKRRNDRHFLTRKLLRKIETLI